MALKIIDLANGQSRREFRAVRLFKQLRHPHLVPMLAFWLKDRQSNFLDESLEEISPVQPSAVELIMAMGLADKSLADRLRECQDGGELGIPVDELLSFLAEAAQAIDFLSQPIHDLGSGPMAIQHCDIKPHNILIVGGAAQVCDLGIARFVGDPRSSATVGSAAYLPPEMITEGRPSAATDQYALAISYCELRTGRLPFQAQSLAGAYFAHLQGKLDFSLLPAAETAVIIRATAIQPEKRFASCTAMVHALRQAAGLVEAHGQSSGKCKPIIKTEPEEALPKRARDLLRILRPGAGQRRQRRRRFTLPLSLIVVCAIGTFGAWLTRPSGVAVGIVPDQQPNGERIQSAVSRNAPVVRLVQRIEEPINVPAVPGPFILESSSRAFDHLSDALAAARASDTVIIRGDGPFVTEPLQVQGKALTIKAAPGTHPILQRAAVPAVQFWQPLLATDRALELEGLELRRPADELTPPTTGPAFLITSEQAPLRLIDCRLLVPAGSAPIVCRNPRMVELRNCLLVASATALCVKVGDGSPCVLQLSGNCIQVTHPQGAALCVYASEIRRPSAVRLHLEHNIVQAGRLASFNDLADGIGVEAFGNDFTFREALISFVGSSAPNGWRHAAAWRGRENSYCGAMEWVQVNGAPAGVGDLQKWQSLWGSPEPGSRTIAAHSPALSGPMAVPR